MERAHELEKRLKLETEKNKSLDEKLENIKVRWPFAVSYINGQTYF